MIKFIKNVILLKLKVLNSFLIKNENFTIIWTPTKMEKKNSKHSQLIRLNILKINIITTKSTHTSFHSPSTSMCMHGVCDSLSARVCPFSRWFSYLFIIDLIIFLSIIYYVNYKYLATFTNKHFICNTKISFIVIFLGILFTTTLLLSSSKHENVWS